jgi:hypothetical protein
MAPPSGVMETTIEIGGMPILVRTDSAEFFQMLERRYGAFVNVAARALFEFNVEIVPAGSMRRVSGSDEVSVNFVGGRWTLERGDFHAEWEPAAGVGRIRQAANPYSIDSALRILHSLLLAKQGGMLVHASSAIKNGRAFLFAGVSGAGKTTMMRLAPRYAILLTDEISYVRRDEAGNACEGGYVAFGTPFAGELATPGENVSAPVGGIYLLAQGRENKIEPVSEAAAVRGIMESVLFFAKDTELVERVFDAVCALVKRVPVKRLTFMPDARVWELIG